MNTKVYGTRICKCCNGICHNNSYRSKYGKRKQYYCSDDCLIKSNQVERFFEKVDVVSK